MYQKIHFTIIIMNQVEIFTPFQESELDQGQYFQSLFMHACQNNMLTDAEIEKLQLELIDLLGKETQRYTNGESSSIRVEKAQEILQSITYNIGSYLKTLNGLQNKINTLKRQKISDLFYKGMDTVNLIKNQAFFLLKNLQKDLPGINNIAYQDTIQEGIGEFFHDYNIEFGAHEMPGSIDYPLLVTNTQLIGAECTYEYLKYFTMENDLLKKFPVDTINLLLRGYHEKAEDLLINIFEIVFTNLLGCEMLSLKLTDLNIPVTERNWLEDKLITLNAIELRQKVEKAWEDVCDKLRIEEALRSYSKALLGPLLVRIEHNLENGSLQEIFITFQEEVAKRELYEEGISMEDEKLREFIEELRELAFVADRVERIRVSVQSLSDFTEILEECFYGKEYLEVFSMLNEAERSFLTNQIQEEAGVEELSSYQPEKEWQKIWLSEIL